MSQLSPVLRRTNAGHAHWCPACRCAHVVPFGWSFDGDAARPTFSPSVKITDVARRDTEEGWEWGVDADGKPIPVTCHYILRAGRIEFCGDSSHELAGRTVDLPPLPAWLRDA